MKPVSSNGGKVQKLLGQVNLFFCLNITIQVMAVTEMSPGNQNAVPPGLQALNNE